MFLSPPPSHKDIAPDAQLIKIEMTVILYDSEYFAIRNVNQN